MSFLEDITHIAVIGSKESIIRMMNAALRNVGSEVEIVGSDDIDTINQKIWNSRGDSNLIIAIPDLLDDNAARDELLIEKKEAFAHRDVAECAEEFESNARAFYIEEILKEGEGYRVEFSLHECESGFYYVDWVDWGDIARHYQCKVFVDSDLYKNGQFDDFLGSTIYLPKDGSVKETRIEPKNDFGKYTLDFDKLIDAHPGRYRNHKILCLENMISRLRYELISEKIGIVKDQLVSNEGHASISEEVTTIPSEAFMNCRNLRSIYIHAGVKEVGSMVFFGCNLEKIEVAPQNPYFSSKGNCLLDKDGKTLIYGCKSSVIPDTVVTIAESAFSKCAGLTKVSLPASVRKIANHAFDWCQDLKVVEFNDGLLEIGGSAFFGCKSLEKVSIPSSVKIIFGNAFRACISLKNVVLPECVKVFARAFQDCPCEKEFKDRYSSYSELDI